jgi:hypothetical protein
MVAGALSVTSVLGNWESSFGVRSLEPRYPFQHSLI